jgi:hypothetical protein
MEKELQLFNMFKYIGSLETTAAVFLIIIIKLRLTLLSERDTLKQLEQ